MRDYKEKYLELRANYIAAVDVAYRKGYEQGQKDAQMQNLMQEQQMQQQMAAQAGQAADVAPAEAMAGEVPDMQAPMEAQQDVAISELEAKIQELEGLLNKSEDPEIKNTISMLKLSLSKMVQARESQKLAKSIDAMKNANKAIATTSKSFNQNAKENTKKALNMQQEIITDIMKKWKEEETDVVKDILSTLKTEGKIK